MARFACVFGGGGLESPEAFLSDWETCPPFAWLSFSVWFGDIHFSDVMHRSSTSTCLCPWAHFSVCSEEVGWTCPKPFQRRQGQKPLGKPVHHSPGCSLCSPQISLSFRGDSQKLNKNLPISLGRFAWAFSAFPGADGKESSKAF